MLIAEEYFFITKINQYTLCCSEKSVTQTCRRNTTRRALCQRAVCKQLIAWCFNEIGGSHKNYFVALRYHGFQNTTVHSVFGE